MINVIGVIFINENIVIRRGSHHSLADADGLIIFNNIFSVIPLKYDNLEKLEQIEEGLNEGCDEID